MQRRQVKKEDSLKNKTNISNISAKNTIQLTMDIMDKMIGNTKTTPVAANIHIY